MAGEAKVDHEIYRHMVNILERHKLILNDVILGELESQFKVDSGKCDLMLPLQNKKPLLVIECKRKIQTPRGTLEFSNFDPMSSKVIDQALNYAMKIGSPLFATTNGKVLALFRMPQYGEGFRIDTHRLIVKEIEITENSIAELLDIVTRWKKEASTIVQTPIDWTFIIRLRSFVKWLAFELRPVLDDMLKTDSKFIKKFKKSRENLGEITTQILTREAAYIIMNKIVFYKILERHYRKLPELKPLSAPDGLAYTNLLNEYFTKVIEVTTDFEPIFSAGIYDDIRLPDDVWTLDEISSFIKQMGEYSLEDINTDIVGFIYEELIPAEERHQLGQFYTPPQIADLIVRWLYRAGQI